MIEASGNDETNQHNASQWDHQSVQHLVQRSNASKSDGDISDGSAESSGFRIYESTVAKSLGERMRNDLTQHAHDDRFKTLQATKSNEASIYVFVRTNAKYTVLPIIMIFGMFAK
mmetsp:Transcript_5982/g.14316  ORF Transcript_5982/g.14316 Transcript_5982/m.14316 type:complete len:115 (-) Transcript_5982:992-1336(-)